MSPSYERILNSKLNGRSKDIQVTETVAKVCLQNLLNHTTQGIIFIQKDDLCPFPNITDVKLIVSYGFDGWNNFDVNSSCRMHRRKWIRGAKQILQERTTVPRTSKQP